MEKPIFVIWQDMPVTQDHRAQAREYMPDYHVLFLIGEPKCQLLSTKDTIELVDLKQVQDYLDSKLS